MLIRPVPLQFSPGVWRLSKPGGVGAAGGSVDAAVFSDPGQGCHGAAGAFVEWLAVSRAVAFGGGVFFPDGSVTNPDCAVPVAKLPSSDGSKETRAVLPSGVGRATGPRFFQAPLTAAAASNTQDAKTAS